VRFNELIEKRFENIKLKLRKKIRKFLGRTAEEGQRS